MYSFCSLSSGDQIPDHDIRIVRLEKANDDALKILQEYYEAINVVVRDSSEAIQKIIDDPSSGVWLAYQNKQVVGCVVLRTLSSIPFASECKRLYVQPTSRGRGIAELLLNALEQFAVEKDSNGFT